MLHHQQNPAPGIATVDQARFPADWDSCAEQCPPRQHRVTKKPGDVLHPGRLDDYCPGAGPRRNVKMMDAAAQRGAAAALVYRRGLSRGTGGALRLIEERRISYTLRQIWPGK